MKAFRRGWFYYSPSCSPDLKACSEMDWLEPGDRRILEYAATHDCVLVSTDSDFEGLVKQVPGAKVVILRSCDYPTDVAAEVLRRNAIRIAELPNSPVPPIVLDQ